MLVGFEGIEQFACGCGDGFDRMIERMLVLGRRPRRAAQLPDKLQCRVTDFVVSCRRIKIEQGLDVSAHRFRISSCPFQSGRTVSSMMIVSKIGKAAPDSV